MAYPIREQHFSRQYPPGVLCSPAQGIQVQIPRQRPNDALYSNHLAYHANNVPSVLQQESVSVRQPTQPQASVLPLTPTSNGLNGHVSVNKNSAASNDSRLTLDYQLLLVAMAEDCFAAARGEGAMVDLVWREMEQISYYKHIAIGLSNLEAVLKHWRLQPHVEALIRLRYASVLHEETENYMEAEETLTKGIAISERHRFIDLKYSMQHLLARVMYSTSPKACFKFLDGVIRDVEAYQHVAWIYAFRFLRVALSLQISSRQETLVAISHLKIIATLASSRGDNAVSATASTIAALTHLRESNSAESIEQSQRALAAARSSQLDPAALAVPQLAAMMHFVDLCCSLQQSDPDHAVLKMQAMQATLDQATNDSNWTEDGICAIPISHNTSMDMRGNWSAQSVIRTAPDGSLSFLMHWLPREDIYALGYLLSGAVKGNRNAMDGQKSEQYLKEGIRMLDGVLKRKSMLLEPLSSSAARALWRRSLSCQMQLHLIFALCARTAWTAAKEQLAELKITVSGLADELPESLIILMHYLEGVIYQGTGDVTSALTVFQHPEMALPPSLTASLPSTSPLRRDLSLLSALNTFFIIRSSSSTSILSQAPHLPTLLSTLEPLCLSNPDKNIQSAYYLARATTHSRNDDPAGGGVVKMKQYLQAALQAAKQCANNQLMCVTLNFMSWRFFRGVVAEQAEKSARASQNLAKKGRDTLWMSVADGMLSETLEMQGKGAEAVAVRREAVELAGRLPVGMQREVGVGMGAGVGTGVGVGVGTGMAA